jgi:hypothetical protein
LISLDPDALVNCSMEELKQFMAQLAVQIERAAQFGAEETRLHFLRQWKTIAMVHETYRRQDAGLPTDESEDEEEDEDGDEDGNKAQYETESTASELDENIAPAELFDAVDREENNGIIGNPSLLIGLPQAAFDTSIRDHDSDRISEDQIRSIAEQLVDMEQNGHQTALETDSYRANHERELSTDLILVEGSPHAVSSSQDGPKDDITSGSLAGNDDSVPSINEDHIVFVDDGNGETDGDRDVHTNVLIAEDETPVSPLKASHPPATILGLSSESFLVDTSSACDQEDVLEEHLEHTEVIVLQDSDDEIEKEGGTKFYVRIDGGIGALHQASAVKEESDTNAGRYDEGGQTTAVDVCQLKLNIAKSS